MKVLISNIKRGFLKLQVENLDDLWYLSNVIDPGDIVSAKTIRKIKLGGEDERKTKITKKKVTLKLKTEKIEFHKYSTMLRISGTITEGPDDIPIGSHHTFNVEEETALTIHKEIWLKFQLDKIKEASDVSTANILICVHDREEAYFALLKRQGYKILSHLEGTVQKKQDEDQVKSTFYSEIIKKLQDYVERHKISQIVLASPAFWKEELLNELKDTDIKKKITQATCSSADETAINEILKRQEIKEVLKKDRIAKEMNLVESLLTEISKKKLGTYGIKETIQAVQAGAVKELLITDTLIRTSRDKGEYEQLDALLKDVEKMKGKVHIIDSEHDGGKKLDGLGGIGALLRFQIEY